MGAAGLRPWLCGAERDSGFLYKTTDYYAPQLERCIAWDDATLAIQWPSPQTSVIQLSAKDRAGSSLADAEVFDI